MERTSNIKGTKGTDDYKTLCINNIGSVPIQYPWVLMGAKGTEEETGVFMPTLSLARCFEFVEDDPVDGRGCHVITEARQGVSKGFLAAIRINTGESPSPWLRSFLKPSRTSWQAGTERTVSIFARLGDGFYEAHSTLRSREAQRVALRVGQGQITIIDTACDEDTVLAAMGGTARPSANGSDYPLIGTVNQIRWAEAIRAGWIKTARICNDAAAESLLHEIADATWFVANRSQPFGKWAAPASRQLRPSAAETLF